MNLVGMSLTTLLLNTHTQFDNVRFMIFSLCRGIKKENKERILYVTSVLGGFKLRLIYLTHQNTHVFVLLMKMGNKPKRR